MSAPYSMDLRWRVVCAREEEKESVPTIARRFQVGIATVKRWLARFHKTGDVSPRPHGGVHPARVSGEDWPVLKKVVSEHSDGTLSELIETYREESGEVLSSATLSRTLKRMGWTRKK